MPWLCDRRDHRAWTMEFLANRIKVRPGFCPFQLLPFDSNLQEVSEEFKHVQHNSSASSGKDPNRALSINDLPPRGGRQIPQANLFGGARSRVDRCRSRGMALWPD